MYNHAQIPSIPTPACLAPSHLFVPCTLEQPLHQLLLAQCYVQQRTVMGVLGCSILSTRQRLARTAQRARVGQPQPRAQRAQL